MKRISALIGGVVLGAALLASCGGGGGSGSSAPNGGPVPPSNTSAPSGSQAFTSSDAVAIPTPAPGAQTVPVPLTSDAASGAAANAAFPASGSVPPDTTVATTYSTSADASVPTLARARATLARTTRDGNSTTNGTSPIAYLRLQFSADVTLPQAPGFTFLVPGTFTTANGVTYWLALYDPLRTAAGWQKQFEGPATVTPAQTASGAAATKFDFASNGKPITFSANQTYYLVLLKVDPNAPSPTPIPSTLPTNSPQPKPAPVVASPANLYFPTVSSSPVPVTFSQQGFTGAFTLHGDCTGIVNTNGASPTWTITPVGQGRCVIIGLGDRGASAVVHVGVVTPFETPHPSPPPTTAPTVAPSHSPEPHESKSPEPTHPPTTAPTGSPSHSPEPTHPPTTAPTTPPTEHPTTSPTQNPSAPTPTPTPGSSNH